MDEEGVLRIGDFVYQFPSRGKVYRLTVPLKLPYQDNSRELAVRLIRIHKIPFHLEDDLFEKLEAFSEAATLQMLDQQAENNLYGGSVFETGSDTDKSIKKWSKHFTENCAQFSIPTESPYASSDSMFSEVYHKLIHSPALETLLQLEHTYAMAVDEVVKGRENAHEVMQNKQDTDLKSAMSALGTTKSEGDINMLMKQHTLQREECELKWSKELHRLRESQKREYRDWVTKVYEDMESSSQGEKRHSSNVLSPPKSRSSEMSFPTSSDVLLHPVNDVPPLEESYTINLGAQKKVMHNVRIIRGHPLNFCKHKRGGLGNVGAGPNPERLQTAMSLYSNKLSALIMMVDSKISSLVGIKEAFAGVCHQSTDFHFPDIDVQLEKIQECASIRNKERKECDLNASFTSSSSESTHPSDSTQEKSEGPRTGSVEVAAGTGMWNRTAGSGYGGGADSANIHADSKLEPGDFYLTRHSNLSQVHAVFHLVTDETEIMKPTLKARHPIMAGLKNCLRTATRHDVYHITIPLLLVHTMQPEMTINWCLKRAEMVFKCVKGFMLENTTWTGSDSRTIQFLVPTGIFPEMFEEFCEMLPKIFRVNSSRNLTPRMRAYSYK